MNRIKQKLGKYNFILGSSSPRRLEILQTNLGILNITVFPSNFPEDISKTSITAEQYVLQTCENKATALVSQIDITQAIILCSDTIIECNSEILEKPKTKQKQREMFEKYRASGSIKVISAVTVCKLNNGLVERESGLETTVLHFNQAISTELIDDYIESEEGLNVAGGFKYQEKGCLLFNRVEGDYFNIVGLPVWKTFELLQKILEIEK